MRLRLDETAKRRIILATLAVVIILLSFALQLAWNPSQVGMGSDSGMFAYGASEILSGRLLYRDFWDNKPPGVFYIDAMAMLIGGEGPWAIWWLGFIWITITILVYFSIMRRIFDAYLAFLGSILFLLTLMYPNYYQAGNFTEVYSLLPQMLCIATAVGYLTSRKDRWIVALGFSTATIFLIKQTNISIGLSALAIILCYDLWRLSFRRAGTHLFYFLVGMLLPIGGVILYWGSRGGLKDLFQATIFDNLQYAQRGLSIVSLYGMLRTLLIVQPMASVFMMALAGAAIFVVQSLKPFKRTGMSKKEAASTYSQDGTWQQWILASIFLTIPLEIFFIATSGRNFGHYYLTPLPVLAVAITYLFSQVKDSLKNWRSAGSWYVVTMTVLVLLVAAWFIEVIVKEAPTKENLSSITHLLHGSYQLDELQEFVMENSEPSQAVLVWDFHPDINFLSKRRAPSRFQFPDHILFAGRNTASRFVEFMEDLNNDPPALILSREKSPHDVPFFGAEGEALCPGCSPEARYGMEQLKAYVEDQYMLIEVVGEWLIYHRSQ